MNRATSFHIFRSGSSKQASSKMQHLCETELKACPNMEIRLVQGDAASEILKAVKAEKADLVVITTHGLSHDKMEKKSPRRGKSHLHFPGAGAPGESLRGITTPRGKEVPEVFG